VSYPRVSLVMMTAVALGLGGCSLGGTAEATPADAGAVESRSFSASDFTSVTAATPDRVVIRQGDTFAVSARGRSGLLDRLVIRADGETLRIGRDDGISYREQERLGTAVITITMPRLSGITLAGSGEVIAEQLEGRAAEVSLAGSGDLTVSNAAVTAIDVSLAGSGDITMTGRADRADVSIAGSGDIGGQTFGARTADVSVTGSGNITMRVIDTADVSLIGSGDVTITGPATCATSRRGSGTIRCGQ
jgi:hypothetical protein